MGGGGQEFAPARFGGVGQAPGVEVAQGQQSQEQAGRESGQTGPGSCRGQRPPSGEPGSAGKAGGQGELTGDVQPGAKVAQEEFRHGGQGQTGAVQSGRRQEGHAEH